MTRPMTNALRAALDGLSPATRRALQAIAQEKGDAGLGPLLRALGIQLRADELAEQAILLALSRDRLADLDELDARHPYPPADPSLRLTVDPDRGAMRRVVDDE